MRFDSLRYQPTSDQRTAGDRSVVESDERMRVPLHLWDLALNDPLDLFLSRCGKRIRAAMTDESFRMAGGRGESPRWISETIELLHAGSLVIDDIEDDSDERRGSPTLHREVGLPLALNTGNWMYFRALEKISQSQIRSVPTDRIFSQVVRTVRRCHEGQALDLAVAVDQIHPAEIRATAYSISRLKTGGLMALSAWLGAAAAGANRVTRRALTRFGMHVGICLQMHNDLNELRRLIAGETRSDDLRNARVTWPWAWATQVMSLSEVKVAQLQLRQSGGQLEALKRIATSLVDSVGDQGDAVIHQRMEKQLRLLGEHVESTQPIRATLAKLRSPSLRENEHQRSSPR